MFPGKPFFLTMRKLYRFLGPQSSSSGARSSCQAFGGDLPGVCNFDREYTNKDVATPPTKDYLPPPPGDAFEGFYFDYRQAE